MAKRTLTYKAQGLYTYPNQFSSPEGGMSDCTGIFIDRPGVIEAARRWVPLATPTLDATYTGIERCYSVYNGIAGSNFGSTLLAQEEKSGPGFGQTYANLIGIKGSSTSNWGNPGGRIFSHFEANGNIYFAKGGCVGQFNIGGGNTNGALIRYTSPATFQTRGAGMPEAPVPGWYPGVSNTDNTVTYSGLTLQNYADTNSSPATNGKTWGGSSATDNNQRAYRVLFSYKDANGNLVRGAPSGRLVVYNPGGGSGLDFGILVLGVQGLLAGDIIQLYASEILTTGVNEPSDDMRLVYEYIVQSADVANKYITIQDIAPDSWRGASLYTDDTQDGILMAEQPPPPSSLATYFKNVAWYAGVNWPGYSSCVLNILGTDAFQTGGSATTISFGSYTLTCDTAEDVTASKFKKYTSGTPGQNLFDTATSICRVLAYQCANDFVAVYATPPNSTSAVIIFKWWNGSIATQGSSQLPSTVTISATNLVSGRPAFSPALPFTTTYPSTFGRLYFSKPNQPEAVPELNYVIVGSPSIPITGMAWLRDSLFIFKPEGLFRVTGTIASDIRVESFDATVRMWPGQFITIAAGGNQLFALCNQGIVSITETGVNIISRQIEDIVTPYANYSAQPDGANAFSATYAFSACASETERKYFIVLGQGTSSALLYCYNFLNQTWTKIPHYQTSSGGCVTAFTNSNTSPIDYIASPQLGAAAVGNISRLGNPDSNSVPFLTSPTWTYNLNPGGNPAQLKRFMDVKLVTYGSGTVSNLSIQFSSDTGASPTTVTVTPYNNTVTTVEVPQDHALCGNLTMKVTGPSSGGLAFYVSEIQVLFDSAGEWTAK